MQLKDFIKASLTEICLAIEEANDELKGSNAVINPKGVRVNSENSKSYGREDDAEKFEKNRVVHKVDFDVAVSISEGETKGKSGKISIASFGIGGKNENSSSNSSVSKLTFSIPVIYPEG